MSVHYKFKAALDFSTVTFDGISISVEDLKKEIIEQKRLAKNSDFDLQVQNAQTKEVYEDVNALIPKNTSVIVARVPVAEKKKGPGPAGLVFGRERFANIQKNYLASLPPAAATKGLDLASMDGTEEDKIKAMMSQSTADYDPSRYMKIRGQNQYGKVPESYTCYKCHKNGHWIKNCPFNSQKPEDKHEAVKKSTGIPRTFMVVVDGPKVPGALITPEGQYAVPTIDHETYMAGKNKPVVAPEPQVRPKIPEELICSLCHDLLTDALMVPCCANSYCDDCIRGALLDSEEQECPGCHEKETLPTFLIPNRFLRTTVNAFKNETGYSKPVKIPDSQETLHKQAQAAAAAERKSSTASLDDTLPEDLFPHSPRKVNEETHEDSGDSAKVGDELYDFNDGSIPSPFANKTKSPDVNQQSQFLPLPTPHTQQYLTMGQQYGQGQPPLIRDYIQPLPPVPPPNFQSCPQYSNQPPTGHDMRMSSRPRSSEEPLPSSFGDVTAPARGEEMSHMRHSGPPNDIGRPQDDRPPPGYMMPMPGQFNPMQPPPGFQHQEPPGMRPPFVGPPGPGHFPQGPYPHHGYNNRHPRDIYPGSYPMDRYNRDDYYRDREYRDRRDRRPVYRDYRDDREKIRMYTKDENCPGHIDDPLKEFERIMREKDRRKQQQIGARKKRSYSRSPPPIVSPRRKRQRSSEERKRQRSPEERKRQRSSEERKQQRSSEERRQQRSSEERRQRKASEERKQRKASEERKQRKASEERKQRKASEERRQQKAEEKRQQKADERKQRKASEERRQQKAEERRQKKASEERLQPKSSEERLQQNSSKEKKQPKSSEERLQQNSSKEKRQQKSSEERMQQNSSKEKKQQKSSEERKLKKEKRHKEKKKQKKSKSKKDKKKKDSK